MERDPATRIQDYCVFGEFGGVNPSITDSATFTFMSSEKMQQLFTEEIEGCFLYSRHMTPINKFLADALARMENTAEAQVMSSGMGAISTALLQICQGGDEIISSRTIYGGTYALLKNFLPKFGIKTHFVNITEIQAIENKITDKTKVIYFETISNPLLEVADIRALRRLADKHDILLVCDNTFSPLVVSPYDLGAHIVVYSLTKFINGTNDCVGGAVCSTHEFVSSMRSVNDGAAMLIGPVMDSFRAASILKNMHTLHLRMKQHSANAMFLASEVEKLGLRVFYPGLPSHPQHELIQTTINPGYGYGGMVTFDAREADKANRLMIKMQEEKVGYFAVSLGFYKTLFSSPGSSTSSEIPREEQQQMGISDGLVRFSVGLDQDMERSFERIKRCMRDVGLI